MKIPSNCLIKFHAEWCAPCKAIAPVIKEVADEKGVEIFEVDIDEQHELANKFGIRTVPTFVAWKDDDAVDMLVGSKSKEALEELADKVLG